MNECLTKTIYYWLLSSICIALVVVKEQTINSYLKGLEEQDPLTIILTSISLLLSLIAFESKVFK